MSTDYIPQQSIPFNQIKELNLGVVHEEPCDRSTEDKVVITDGKNYLWAYKTHDDNTVFSRYGANDASQIIQALEDHFGTELVSEFEDEFDAMVDERYSDDFVKIPLPTDENRGLWKRIWPPEENDSPQTKGVTNDWRTKRSSMRKTFKRLVTNLYIREGPLLGLALNALLVTVILAIIVIGGVAILLHYYQW